MAAEPTTRFAHLLQPIRDLSKVWKIEIADELEKYIEEVAQLLVMNPEDGITQLNFAEAALLIQGSTAIYSRKVELLYQLVYQALDLLALDKVKDAQGKKGKGAQSGLWGPIPDTDELLTIDHLIKEGRNILLDHSAPEQRQALQRRVPLFLMPRDQADRRKREFRISSCSVHHTGVYLLQESDAKLLDDLTGDSANEGHADAPLVPAPPLEVQDLDNRLQELLRELPEDPAKPAAPGGESPKEDEEGKVVQKTPAKNASAMKTPLAGAGNELVSAFPATADPWAFLDEHETVGKDLPLEVGKTSTRVNAKKLLMNAEGLPDAGSGEAISDADLWSGNTTADVAAILTAGHPVETLFLAVAGHLKSGGRYETQHAGFSAAWLEFEDLFAAAAAKRRQFRMAAGKARWQSGAAPATPPGPGGAQASDGEASDGEGGDGRHDAVTPVKLDLATPLGKVPVEQSEEMVRHEEQRREVAMLENMIQDAQQKYESTVRQHLQMMQKDVVDADNRKFPQLYARVRKWQEQLEPVLKEFESRPEFDIHCYSTKFLKKLADINKSGDEEKVIPFARLVHAQPRWEVCRRFLTCLILTNHGNTDIHFGSEEERLNKFGVKLLKADKPMISLEGDDSAAAAPLPPPGRSRKAAAPARPQDEPSGGGRKRQKKGAA